MKKLNKPLKSIITLLFPVIFLAAVNINAQTAVKPAGNGTFTPYKIATLENLFWVTQNPNEWWKDFEQTADIDASSSNTWDGGNGFTPIGNSSIRFTGTYDGNGFTITGLFINRSSTFFVGMFGVVEQIAEIKNLGLINVDITGRYGVGGLVGSNAQATITACFSSGSVSDNMNVVGGLVGVNASSGIISSSYSNVTVTGSGSYKGGFIGLNEGTINNSYSTGSVNGGGTAGGFAGRNTGTINNSFWDTQTSGLGNAVSSGSSAGITAKTTAEMKTLSTFINAGWDFEVETDNGTDNYWDFDRLSGTINNGYPFLSWQNGSAVAISKGDNLADAIDLGDLQVGSYSQGQKSHNNNTSFYTNLNTASTGSDVYYKINIIDNVTSPGHIGGRFRTVGATFNSVLYLLDASGNQIVVNDGAGNNSQIQDFSATLTAGTYYVVVDGADASQMGSFSLSIQVSMVPDAKFTSNPENGCSTPHTVFFTDQSFNPDIWQWNFGDGGTSTAKNPIHTYTTSGTFIVTLAIQDTIWGGSDTFVDTVVVSNLVTDFSGTSLFGCGPLTVDFTDASVGAVSWEWTFGDGDTSTAQNPSHTYDKPGAYTVTLKTINSTGCDDTLTRTNYVQVIGPDVNFGIASTSGALPLTVTFRDSTTATSPIVGWIWNFGDGGTSTDQNPTHIYNAAGTYNVSLTVNDLDGCSRTLTKNGIVNTGSSVTINQAAGQSDPSNSSAINFTVVFNEPVTGFETGDVTLSGTAGATTGTVTEIAPNDGTTYNVAVTGMTNDGTVIASITAGVAVNAGSVTNLAGTSTDNTVTYDTTVPTVSIGSPSSAVTGNSPVSYGITYVGATTINLTEGDVVLNTTGSANGSVSVSNGTTINPTVTISNISGVGSIGISINPGTSSDASGNLDLGAGPSQVFSTNTAPYFGAIQNKTINEDDTLKISVAATDDDGDGLSYESLSSDSSVKSYFVENVLYVVPDSNWSGSSNVVVYVSDPYQTATWTFRVDVQPVNDAPQISFQLSPVTFNEDEEIMFLMSEIYPFITDADNADSTLIVTLESKSGNLTVTDVDDTTVIIGSKADWYGLDSITVNVSDGELTTNSSFAVNVIPVNDMPLFTNLPETINFISSVPIAFDVYNIVSDIETPDELLQFDFSTITDSLLYNYDSENGLLNLNTLFGFSGETVLTIQATDENGGVSEISINVIVENNITGIEDLTGIPNSYEVSQNYPNPFNPSTKIRYGLPNESKVHLVIYNILGQEIAVLKNTTQNAGYHEVEWNASRLSSGMYIYRLTAESTNGDNKYTQVKKMLMLK